MTCSLKNTKHCQKKLKMTQLNGNKFHVQGLEELILNIKILILPKGI